MAEYYKTERGCEECGERFWGTAGAHFCSSACRSRQWRAVRIQKRSRALAALCAEVGRRGKNGSGSYSKLLIRLLRTTAGELRSRGWDPHELIWGSPEDPVTGEDESLGGVEGESPQRVKWMHSPALELEMLEKAIERRARERKATDWYEARRAQLVEKLRARS